MERGGFREGAGRKSKWSSSSKTTAIRIPSWMAEEILRIAREKDENQASGNERDISQKVVKEIDIKLTKVGEVIENWRKKGTGKEDSPRWKNLHLMVIEIEKELTDI